VNEPLSADPPLRGVRLPLTVSVILLCGLGTVAVAGAAGYAPAFARAFIVAAALRLVLGRDGRALLPRRVLLPLGYTVSAAALAYLFQRLGGAGGPQSLWTLMCVTSVFEALVLLWRQTTFSSFLLILFSSVHAAGIAFAHDDGAGLMFLAAYVAGLVWTLVLFERRAALERAQPSDGGVHHVRAPGALMPWRCTAAVSVSIAMFGLPLGVLLYLAAPRGISGLFGAPPSHRQEADPRGPASQPGFAIGQAESKRTAYAFAGPGGDGAPLGSVAQIKRNFEPWFEVSLEGRTALPPRVILRDNALDFYRLDGLWQDTLTEEDGAIERRDGDDGRRDGWVPLGFSERGREAVTLHIEALRGGQARLYLQPDEVGLEIRRAGRPLSGLRLREFPGKRFDALRPLKTGDVIIERYVKPETRDALLVGRRSDEDVAPRRRYVQVPAACRGPLRRRALQVVGRETDPWRRARLLEAWLKSPAFTYSLKVPALDRSNPIVDFVERTRTANCEAFAYALALMLRTLGHPTRYVRGFWGGDLQRERKSVILRGVHYHAWCEMYLEGAGWVALNPTPPDRRAVDAETQTAAEEAWRSGADETAGAWSFLGYDAAGWHALWSGVGGALQRWVARPVLWLFQRRTGYVGIPLLFLLAWLLRRRRTRRRLERLVVAPGRKLPGGAYGQALLLLARRGIRRRPQQTVREVYRSVRRRLPAAAPALKHLTLLHEARMYGGHDRAALDRRAIEPLRQLRRALQQRG